MPRAVFSACRYVAQGFCWALLVVLAIPVLPVAIALEWIEERLYGHARTVGVLHD